MGMFDEIRCLTRLPDDRFPVGTCFQTKSLYCGLYRFTMTEDRRLFFHKERQEPNGAEEVMPGIVIPQYKRVHEEDIDINYHGDIRMCAVTKNKVLVDYVARFTHGQLE